MIPNFITNIDKQRNLTILKQAYSDLHTYLKMFDAQYYCDGVLTNCFPAVDEKSTFALEFAKFLEEKQGFRNIINDYLPANGVYKRMYLNGITKDVSTEYQAYKSPSENGSFLLISPKNNYAYFVTHHMYDNYYSVSAGRNGDRYRARVFIYTDLKRLGICKELFCTEDEKKKAPRMGKYIFVSYISNFESIRADGNCTKDEYYCKPLSEATCSKEAGVYKSCFYKIVQDGWRIKSDYPW